MVVPLGNWSLQDALKFVKHSFWITFVNVVCQQEGLLGLDTLGSQQVEQIPVLVFFGHTLIKPKLYRKNNRGQVASKSIVSGSKVPSFVMITECHKGMVLRDGIQ